MIFCNKNYFWTLFVVAVSLSVAQHGSVFCETKTIDLIGDVISMYLSPIDVDGLSSGDNSFIIGEKFSMYIKADINDPKVRAEIKEGTLEWRLKSVTFYYYVPSENELGYERVKEATFIDNNTLANSPYHPITFSRPIGVWGKCATWQIVKTSANPHNESSTFNSPGTWDVEFEIEFQGKHKDIKDCMVQSNTRGTKWNFALKHYLGMIVDDYAVEGTDDVLGVQFGIVNKDMKSEKRIADIRLFFEAFFKIDWATDNNIGLVENDFIRMNPNSLSIFRSKNENGMDETNKVERYNNAFNQYFININRNFWGQNETVTSNFFLKADNGPNTETKLIENAKISIMDYQRGNLSTPLQIKYYVITTDIQENLGTNYPHGTEGRYLVSVSEINVIKATTLFGGKNNSNITGIRQGHPDAPADNGINLNDVIQGGIGDCYFLACLMALAKDSKGFIRTHLTEENNVNEPLKYKLKVYDKNKNEFILKFQIDSLFTHGISQAKLSGDYDDSNNQKRIEIWPQVYEKAWAAIKKDAKTFGDIDYGNPKVVWEKITGKNATVITLTNLNNRQIWHEIVSRLPTATFTPNCYLVAGTPNIISTDPSLYDKDREGKPINLPDSGHAYFIDGFIDDIDDSKKKVLLLNPHGVNNVKLPFSELSKVLNAIIILNKP